MENQTILPPTPEQLKRPKTWLIESIIITVLCCLPFGIVGIINATKVNSLYDQGLYNESLQKAKNARRWTLYGFIAGFIYLIIVLIMMLNNNDIFYKGTSEGLVF